MTELQDSIRALPDADFREGDLWLGTRTLDLYRITSV